MYGSKDGQNLIAETAPIQCVGFENPKLPSPVAGSVKFPIAFFRFFRCRRQFAVVECLRGMVEYRLRTLVATARQKASKGKNHCDQTGGG